MYVFVGSKIQIKMHFQHSHLFQHRNKSSWVTSIYPPGGFRFPRGNCKRSYYVTNGDLLTKSSGADLLSYALLTDPH